ncbi:MAG: hydroxymethylbilane synthase [Acidobacteria bacterium]|nr:MAG: hydroxymethylbilane synthase [Acidobacteriota bacterium]
MRKLVIGSRGSPLALRQSALLQEALQKHHPDLETRIEIIRTTGDQTPQADLSKLAASVKGLFVKEIEEALLQHQIDLAVHSLKDLPTQTPEGLTLAAIPPREDARDALVTASPTLSSLQALPQQARLGTGSLRRRVQLQLLRPDLVISPIRGNVETRIKKIEQENLDGIILAAAGLNRLGLHDKIAYIFPVEEMVPAIGQGALAIEIRTDDESTRRIVEPVDDPATRSCTLAERRFLHEMGGGCDVPMGAHASIENDKATFTAFVAGPRSLQVARTSSQGKPQELDELALEAARYLLAQGGDKMLEESSVQYQP